MSAQARGVALCLFAGTAWSVQGLLLRGIAEADPWQVNAWRSGLTGLLALAYVLVRYRGGSARAFASVGTIGLFATLFYAGSNTAFIVALALTTVANTLFMLSAEPLIVALLAWIILRERIHASTWLSIALAFVGVSVMIGGGIGEGRAIGSLVALAGSLSFAAFTVTLRFRPMQDMLPVIVLAGIVVAVVSAAVTGGDLAVVRGDLVLCAGMAVASAIGSIAFLAGARVLPAAQVLLLAMAEVVLGPLWVFLAYGERPAEATLFGGVIVLGAVVLQTLAGARARS